MKVMVIGGGGREHALVWKIKQSPKVDKVICAPGNAGICEEAECVNVSVDDLKGLVKAVAANDPDLVVVGPEGPLTMGLADRLAELEIPVFGPSRAAAEIEGSKVFAKMLMQKYNIPTAGFHAFSSPEVAREFIEAADPPMVVKADGLAAGKGVILCDDRRSAIEAVDLIMREKAFGAAGARVVVEEMLVGEEASFLAFTDGERVLPLASSQDHKRIFDGDKGPNTGGMGAYSPAPVVDQELHDRIMNEVMIPTVRAMRDLGKPYRGVLYAGLMMTSSGPKVLEYNARFGDPETQPLLFRMQSDIIDLMLACANPDGSLADMRIEWGEPTVCVVMASRGYPGKYEKGFPISGLDEVAGMDDVKVFHAGTAKKDGRVVTSGGRVLGVTARGPGIAAAIDRAYQAAGRISWEGAYFRADIGRKALLRRG